MSQNEYPLSNLGLRAKEHWRKYRPKMSRDLERQGKLDAALYAAQELTAKALADAILRDGLSHDQAWELVREEWIFLPDEEDVPELGFDPASLTPLE